MSKPAEKQRHNWTLDNIRTLYGICQIEHDTKKRISILKGKLPATATESAIEFAVKNRYQKRNDNKLEWNPELGIFEGFGSNGKKWNIVWDESDWTMKK